MAKRRTRRSWDDPPPQVLTAEEATAAQVEAAVRLYRRTGETETMIRQAVVAHLARRGHGSATRLGTQIGRPASWIGQFVRGERRPTIDDAVQLADALDLPLRARKPKAAPVDTARLRAEAKWLRLFHRLEDRPDTLMVAVDVVTALARRRNSRINRSTTLKSSSAKERSNATPAARVG